MTIYEQIQNALDHIESNLFNQITIEEVAYEANMSVRSFHNYFSALTRHTFKEYVVKRRLTKALLLLQETEDKIIEIAYDSGYESHEAFSRAFKNEFGISPIHFRKSRLNLKGLEKIKLVKEMYMGIIVKELPEMRVVSYIGFSPDPETKAHDRIWKWAKKQGLDKKPHRNFGHDTDAKGKGFGTIDHNNYGYKVMQTISDDITRVDNDLNIETIKAGRFAVIGVEGDVIHNGGKFITEGWQKLGEMAKKKGYEVKGNPRCFEEKLEASVPDYLRLDLYMEIV
jgi:AraC-like DNA-binding protein/DNA gyrase inhibitor GyrI